MDFARHKQQIDTNGFTIINEVFTLDQIDAILSAITTADSSRPTFRKSSGIFAIRQFLKEIPEAGSAIFTPAFIDLIQGIFGSGNFVTKSIYFDKPEQSNWFVAYHQDLTISVKEKIEIDGFGPWTVKQRQFAVQPPLEIVQNNFTIRIHLDETTSQNGALKVIRNSHSKGIYRPENIDWETEEEAVCEVRKGGIMIMRPLLLHASDRTTNDRKRRVIHIEFGKDELPEGLEWSEKMLFEKREFLV
ncbi:phytanoyl-CoA dioxygenase family protein [Flavobacterium selenitireducens]|uniref:phytanoyl-CoA dioxygenase family protein n=1 Tax=Flavobacterium selenitireducens TaxID=2722704 RepID=UPI00168B740A|nr:phytanoyl-CoA dioxygenase family protein [Flavobacterium selenitireducens]MBD3583762.1 phytanoyl-CoA dioxygenase family protein [Flavobacterium selenitireducens]